MERALVLFSGGQDSATCLAWALDRYDAVETVGFDYGQRHSVELDQRGVLLDAFRRDFPRWSERLGGDTVLDMATLGQVSETALTRDAEIEMTEAGLPSTFVPARNLIFLSYAAALAYRRGIRHLVTGVCETDYSGYPDCRDDTMKALQVALNLGMDTRLVIETPLMWTTKPGTWEMAERLGGEPLVEVIRRESHSCYVGDRSHEHDWGFGCGTCPACVLRANGWQGYRAVRRAPGETAALA